MNMPVLDPQQLIEELGQRLKEEISPLAEDSVRMIGIYTGGVWVAEALHRYLDLKSPLGTLDISFYRDDFSESGLHPQVSPSNLPFDIDGKTIILVDDVLQSGRTVRGALNEIFDYGRPERVILATLIERGRRELPIQANFIGTHVDLEPEQQIKLSGPQPLTLQVIDS